MFPTFEKNIGEDKKLETAMFLTFERKQEVPEKAADTTFGHCVLEKEEKVFS